MEDFMRHDAVTVATHSCLVAAAKSSVPLPVGGAQLCSLDLRRIHITRARDVKMLRYVKIELRKNEWTFAFNE